MSDRIKSLVVYALQGRYDVDAVDTKAKGHAIELCREAAHEGYDVVVAFGGDGTVNEAANGLAGSAHAADVPAGRRHQRLLPHARHPHRRRRRHRAPARARRRLARAARSTSGGSASAGSRSRPAWASTPASSSASTATRASRRASAPGTSPSPRSARSCAATSCARRGSRSRSTGKKIRGVSAFVQNGDLYTYFQSRPIHVAGDSELDSGDFSGAVLTRASAIDLPTVMFRALSKRAEVARHRRVTPSAACTR